MNNPSQITEQYLNGIYENLQKEQFALMNDIKTGCEADKEKHIAKQLTHINTINLHILRLRNIRKNV
jgi:uncharacterized protein YllA (UPF0747 family)